MGKPDRRVEKTKMAIYQALNDLLREKKYANISVQEIIDSANVGRTTFYSHFSDKDELLISCIRNIFESFNIHQIEQSSSECGINNMPVAELFAHVQEKSHLITGVLMSESSELILSEFKNYWNKKIESFLLMHRQLTEQQTVPMDIFTNHATSSLVELLRWWNKTGAKYTPKEMEEFYFALLFPNDIMVHADRLI